MTHETYEYTLTTAKGFLLMVVCGLITVWAGYMAATHQGSLSVAGFSLGMQGATFAYLVLATVTGWVTFDEIRSWMRPAERKAPIVLDNEAISAPAQPDNPAVLRLSYKGISDIKTRSVSGNRVIEIRHMDGNLTISGSALGSREAFDSLLQSLQARVALTRGYRY
ncbi:hypothetical protein [Maritimibacter sp. UBA3975]|uniref:hypothetical protein n=1 Tax=Maritimibacter sp. UBA3975 TaxID=1946833 RepID=UPI000C0AE917|nr:hypothetical protein [Maritimibacter sp. UBA3975]MAM63702.1 hypothetical protein [Maritimibacter sp.]|tara:strand:- start:940 stop:1437 length:498 start_codon:yes stop_codon:yes gene_type:complete